METTARQEFILPIIRRATASRSASQFVHHYVQQRDLALRPSSLPSYTSAASY